MSKIESPTAKYRRLRTEGKTVEEAIKESGVSATTARVQDHNLRKQGLTTVKGPRKPRSPRKTVKESVPPAEEEELDEDEEEDIDEEDIEGEE